MRKRLKMQAVGVRFQARLFRGPWGDGMKGLHRKSSGRRESSVSEWEGEDWVFEKFRGRLG